MRLAGFLVGASGVGKATVARVLERRATWKGRTHFFISRATRCRAPRNSHSASARLGGAPRVRRAQDGKSDANEPHQLR